MKIKICGLSRPEDIEYANRLGPDYIGFVFAKSSRQISYGQAARLKDSLRRGITAVGVFVDAPLHEIINCLEMGIIDMAQLHGQETERDIRSIRSAAAGPVIKAVKVRSQGDVEKWLNSSADYLLFDSGQGTGKAFDWSLLHGVERDFFLAGGIGAENMEEACRLVKPWCIDVSSGAETNGVKDPQKMAKLIETAHGIAAGEQRKPERERNLEE